jgi:hypothetical protein
MRFGPMLRIETKRLWMPTPPFGEEIFYTCRYTFIQSTAQLSKKPTALIIIHHPEIVFFHFLKTSED